RTTNDQLRRATGNKAAQPLQHLGASIGAGLSYVAPRRQALERQLATYADTLRLFGLLNAKQNPLLVPTLKENTPVTEALADLARLESEVLAQQALALQRLSANVGAPRWLAHPLAIATAESNIVAPGDTYRAQLGLIGYFSAHELRMQMTCNGRPVLTSPNGTGLISFRAPTRPGPATWTGTIRISSNNRDSTFRVTLCLAADHVARMQQAAAALYLTLPAPLATTEALTATLGQLAEANNLPAARLRVQLWRSGGGRYTPLTDAAEWLATAEPFAPDNTPVGRADFARDTHSSYSPLSFCKGPQAWRYVRAAHERQQRGLDEIILCNADGHVAEAGAAAIFWLKQDVLSTPALTSGCVAGVRRADILRRAATL
nr:hypothetical protein [Tanacetum cinerariifolium]